MGEHFWRFQRLAFAGFILGFFAASSARAAVTGPTLVSRETFQGVRILNAANPGNLGTVEGHSAFNTRAVGPKVAGDTTAAGRGWSADLHLGSANPGAFGRHDLPISGTARAAGFFSCWYYVDGLIANGNRCDIVSTFVGDGNQLIRLMLDPATGNFWYNRNGLWTDTNGGAAFPVRQWFELRVQWLTSGNSCSALAVDYRLAGGINWTNLYATTTPFNMGEALTTVRGGSLNLSGSASGFRGRYGMPSLYALSSWADRLAPAADVLDPPAGPFAWFVNPATGNDASDGATPDRAWASVTKLNAESQYCGLFPTVAGYANGDSLTVDTTAANLPLGPASLTILTRGLNLLQLGGGRSGTGEIQAWTTLPAGNWSPVSGNVYRTTLPENNPSCVMWEDDRWLNHVTADTFTGAAALNVLSPYSQTPYPNVTAALQANPGSFWTDGTTLYFHPFGDTDPRADGKSYTRSYSRGDFGTSAVQLLAPDVHVNGLRVRKTCLADRNTNDPILAYCLQGMGGFGGTSLIENCYLDYGSKHCLGLTDPNANGVVTVADVQCEQGTPYASQTPFVSYSSGASNLNNVHTYLRCVNLQTRGTIGSTAGNNDALVDSLYMHNNGGNGQYAQVNVTACNFGGTIGGYGVTTLNVTDSTLGGSNHGADVKNFHRCHLTFALASNSGPGQTLTARNNLVTPSVQWNGGLNGTHELVGVNVWEGNTFDFNNVTTGATGGIFKRSGAATLIFRDNACRLFSRNGTSFALLENGVSTDSYTFTNNALQPGTNARVAIAYNDGSTTADRSFAQWQALGFDANSFLTMNLQLGADYRPALDSPLVDAGTDLGPGTDLSGRFFAVRRTLGALEPDITFARWQRQRFTAAERNDPAISGDGADPDGNGLSNLLEYALARNFGAAGPATATGTVTLGAARYLTLTYRCLADGADLQFQPESSGDLTGWATGPGAVEPVSVTDEGDGTETVVVRDAAPLGGGGRFLRLRVQRSSVP